MSTSPPVQPPAQPASASRLERARVNAAYLALGGRAAQAPASLATRSALTSLRYAIRYVLRRLVRYAKYAAIGAAAAALGGGLLGTVGSGVAFFAAPSLGVGMALGVGVAVIKFGWRHRGNHLRGGVFGALDRLQARANAGHDAANDERANAAGAGAGGAAAGAARYRREDVWMRS
ncbi:hypothetical protein Q5752_003141 [Cryptotrichosporon argae]